MTRGSDLCETVRSRTDDSGARSEAHAFADSKPPGDTNEGAPPKHSTLRPGAAG